MFYSTVEDDGNLLKVRTLSPLVISEWKQELLSKVEKNFRSTLVPDVSFLAL